MDEILASATQYLRDNLKFSLKQHEEINGGMTNRLFHLKSDDTRSMILKWYYGDDKNRLQREFEALIFLRQQGFVNVPVAHHKDEKLGYALYSFVPGKTLPFRDERIQNVTHTYLDQMVDFIVALHSIERRKDNGHFAKATGARLGIIEYVNGIETDLQSAENILPTLPYYVGINKHFDIFGATYAIRDQLKASVPKSMKLNQLEHLDMRLSPVDFGSHNILVESGTASFIDFEDFGWDDPMQIVAYPTPALTPEDREYFLTQYLAKSPLSPEVTERLPVIVELRELAWTARLLLGLAAETIEKRRFAIADFDIASYVTNQCNRINRHLSSLRG